MNSIVVDLLVGAGIGLVGSLLMDMATGWFYTRQSEASRQREQEIAPGGTLVLGGRKTAAWVGRDVTDAQAARIGLVVHRLLGISYGVLAALLTRNGTPPLGAGLVVGTLAFFIVDEAAMSLLFVPPPWAYPLESHLRGVVGHLSWGVVAGVLLSVARMLGLVTA
jgi:uncharacterized membrane protein YagU involved in acid resistance